MPLQFELPKGAVSEGVQLLNFSKGKLLLSQSFTAPETPGKPGGVGKLLLGARVGSDKNKKPIPPRISVATILTTIQIF